MVNSHGGQSQIDPLMPRRSGVFIALGIFTVALLVRILYLAESSENPTFFYPIVDSHTYHTMAAELAGTGRMDSTYFWQPFFYPFFLSIVYRLAGPSVLAAKLLQILLGSATCSLSYLLGRQVFSRAVGITAGLITAFYGPLIFYETELIAAGWSAFWAVALCLLLLRVAKHPTIKCSLLLGLCSVLAIITRPTFLPFCAAAWIWLSWRWIRQIGLSRRALLTTALVIGFTVVAVPLGMCFKRATGRFTILPYSAGINMYIGNNPNSSRTLIIRPGWEWMQLVKQPERQGIEDPWGAQAYFLRQVRQYLINDPAEFTAGIGRKTLQFVSSREIPRNIDPYLFARWSLVLSILNLKVGGFGLAFGLLLPLAMIGLISRWREVPVPIWLMLLLYPAAVITVFVSGRYRVPVIPVMAVMAAVGAGFIIQAVQRRRWPVLALSAILAAGTVALASLPGPFSQELPNYEAEMYHGLGSFYYYPAGQLKEAAECFQRATELDSKYVDAYVALGNVRELQGRLPEAEACLRRALQIAPDNQYTLNSLGLVYLRKRDYE